MKPHGDLPLSLGSLCSPGLRRAVTCARAKMRSVIAARARVRSKHPEPQTASSPDCWTPRVAGLDGAASASFLTLLAADGFGPGGKARPPAPLWPPPARSSPSFPSLLSLSPSSAVLLAPCKTEEQCRCELRLWSRERTETELILDKLLTNFSMFQSKT